MQGDDAAVMAIARAAYEACHPDDTFEDLMRRAVFSKEDRGLLRDWRRFAVQEAHRAKASEGAVVAGSVPA